MALASSTAVKCSTEVGPVEKLSCVNSLIRVWAVALGIAAPLEFLPHIAAVSGYATLGEAWTMAGEFALVLLLASAVTMPLLTSVGALWGAWRGHTAAGIALGLRAHAMLLLSVSLIHGAKVWLGQSFLPLRELALAHSAVWGMASLGLFIWLHWRAELQNRNKTPNGVLLLAGLYSMLIAVTLLAPAVEATTKAVRKPPPTDRHPDVILVTVDTFAARHASLYGYPRPTTPHLDAFAAGATVFDRFYANANFTTAGVASLTGGIRPWTHRVFLAPGHVAAHLPERSLVAHFHNAGYRTLAVSSNPWAAPANLDMSPWLDAQRQSQPWAKLCPWDLDNLIHLLAGPKTRALLAAQGWYAAPRTAWLHVLLLRGICPPSGHFDPDNTLGYALKLLDENPAEDTRPTLLWVHLTPPHDPYAPPPPFVGRFDPSAGARTLLDSSPAYHYDTVNMAATERKRLQARYDEALLYTDSALGTFIDALKQRGRLDQSLLVVSADHGESFRNDYGAHGGPELFDDVLHIPLVIKLPDQVQNKRIGQLAEQADLLPTIAAIAKVELSAPVEGRSLLPLMQGAELTDSPIWAMSFERQPPMAPLEKGNVAMIEGNWKLHLRLGMPDLSNATPKRIRLFNLKDDPEELNDISNEWPVIRERMETSILNQLKLHTLPQ